MDLRLEEEKILGVIVFYKHGKIRQLNFYIGYINSVIITLFIILLAVVPNDFLVFIFFRGHGQLNDEECPSDNI
jgi:hypothetical protein